jgi:hypothetical protein
VLTVFHVSNGSRNLIAVSSSKTSDVYHALAFKEKIDKQPVTNNDNPGGRRARSILADHLVQGMLDPGPVGRIQNADWKLQACGIDGEDFIGGEHEKTLAGYFDQWRHDLDRLGFGSKRNDYRRPGSAGDVVVLDRNEIGNLSLLHAGIGVDMKLRQGLNPVEFLARQSRGGNVPTMRHQGIRVAFRPGAIFQFIKQAREQLLGLSRKVDLLLVRFKAIQQGLINGQ